MFENKLRIDQLNFISRDIYLYTLGYRIHSALNLCAYATDEIGLIRPNKLVWYMLLPVVFHGIPKKRKKQLGLE